MPKPILCFVLPFMLAITAHAQIQVTFKTGKVPPTKNDLFLAGSFNGWSPYDKDWRMTKIDDSTYAIAQTLTPGRYSFKVTQGGWDSVEQTIDGYDIENREFLLVRDTAILLDIAGWKTGNINTKPRTASVNVQVLTERFNMPHLMRQGRVWVYLPEKYATSKRKYPVVYMHDGQNLFDEHTAGFGEWKVDETMDKLPDEKQSIIVGIDHGGQERLLEYNPYNSKYGKGKGEKYIEFIVSNLKPYIDEHYRTQTDAQHTTITGSSMGGLISTYAILKYPQVFGNAGVFSPAYWIAPDIYAYAKSSKLTSNNRIYFACGDSEGSNMVPDMKAMAAITKNKTGKNNSPAFVLKNQQHNEKQWAKGFQRFYKWLVNGR